MAISAEEIREILALRDRRVAQVFNLRYKERDFQ